MQFKTECALSIKGDRIERGAIVELTVEEAAAFGADLVVYEETPKVEETAAPEKAIDEMSHTELKAKAKELGLAASGSVADLRERIALNDGAPESEQSDEEENDEEESEQSDEED